MHKKLVMSGGRYPVLRALALLYLIGAGLAVVGGIVAIGWILMRAPATWGDKMVLCGTAIASTFFLCISLLAIAEVLKLFMDIEHNSRMMAVGGSNVTVATTADANALNTSPAVVPNSFSTHSNRIAVLDEETAEGALVRGH